MSWIDRLRPASFAGITFRVREHELAGGRRTTQHEFPQRERPYTEDTGRRAKRFNVRGYILGDDYDVRRDRLIEAFDAKPLNLGPPIQGGQTLVHPYLGSFSVYVDAYAFRETTDEGRICTFDVTFVEIGGTKVPKATVATDSAADEAAEGLGDAADTAAADDLTDEGAEEVLSATSTAILAVGQELNKLNVFGGPIADVASFQDQVTQLISNATSLATSPATLISQVKSTVLSIYSAAGNFLNAFEAYRTLFGFQLAGATGDSLNARKSAANTAAVVNLTRQHAVGQALRAAVRHDWVSRQDAESARDDLVAEIDALATCSARGVCTSLPSILAVAVDSLPDPDESLPSLETITLHAWEPGLVTSWRLYQDPGRAGEIARRNDVPRAGFLPADQPLEVLIS